MTALKFWEHVCLANMTDAQWESLCDGCGLCCLHKFEDVETSELHYTCVKCRFLADQRQCGVYSERTLRVEGCLDIREIPVEQYRWLPESCAYRRLANDQPLPSWHPLMTGDSKQMAALGIGVGDWAIPDDQVDEVDEDFIVNLPQLLVDRAD